MSKKKRPRASGGAARGERGVELRVERGAGAGAPPNPPATGPGRRRLLVLLGAVVALAAGAVLTVWRPRASPEASSDAPLPAPRTAFADTTIPAAAFVGSAACAGCHAREYAAWKGSTHAAAGGAPSEAAVIARFNGPPIRFRDAVVVPRAAGGRYSFVVRQAGLPERVLTVDGVIGGGHMEGGGTQGFVTRSDDGTYRFLPFDFSRHSDTWFCNTIGRADHGWVPITPELSLRDCVDWMPTRALGDETRFNNCQSCHGSQITVSLDSAARGYRTAFTTLAINCESCHGPGARHVRLVREGGAARGDVGMTALAALPKDSSLGVCWQCHALKDQLRPGWVSGKPLEAYYSLRTPQLGEEPHLPDGRVRTFAYQQGHLFSDCYVNGGMTCTSCHDPHSQGYRDVNGDALRGRFDDRQCTSCHASKAERPELHTKHATGSAGSRCTSCHMPYLQEPQVGSAIRYARSDHAIPIPRPAFDSASGVVSACKGCHADRTASALDAQMRTWYGEVKPQARAVSALVRAKTLTDRGEIAELLLVPDERHTAALYAGMAWFLDQHLAADMPSLEAEVVRRLEALSTHEDVDVRALALASLHYARGTSAAVRGVLARALTESPDADRLLRPRWAVILGYLADRERSRGNAPVAVTVYRKALEVEPRNARLELNLGLAYADAGRLAEAVEAYRRSIAIDPRQPLAHVNLGIALQQQGQLDAAVAAYQAALAVNGREPLAHFNLGNAHVLRNDLARAAESYRRAVALDPSIALAHFSLARVQLQQRDFAGALRELDQGLALEPEDAEARAARDQLRESLGGGGGRR